LEFSISIAGVSDGATHDEALLVEGLRERKKRLMRQLISDTATEMFLDRGFDEVKVTEVAAACGVSEKTVYNYFPTKEALMLDREENMAVSIRAALGPTGSARSPIAAALEALTGELRALRELWRTDGDLLDGPMLFIRFTDLVDGTPSLRAAQRDVMDRLVQVAAEALAERAGVSPDDPEPQIAANAIIGLWRIQFQAMRRHADAGLTPDEIIAAVTDEVERAARLIDSGLWAFAVMTQGTGSREQLKVAGEAAQHAGRQVATALRQARAVWRQIEQEVEAAGLGGDRSQPDRRTQRERHEQWKRHHREQQDQRKQAVREQRREWQQQHPRG
jgi:AcrR family transcriptional regulator